MKKEKRLPIGYVLGEKKQVVLSNDQEVITALFGYFARMHSEAHSRATKRGIAEAKKRCETSEANEVIASARGKGHVAHRFLKKPLALDGKKLFVNKSSFLKVHRLTRAPRASV